MSIYIKWTRYSQTRLLRGECPTCERRTFFACFFEDYYGWREVCLRCGDSWSDGEMQERPFMPAWRKKSIESTKRTYRQVRERIKKWEHEQ